MKTLDRTFRILLVALGAVFLLSAALLGKCAFDRYVRRLDHDLMRIVADDVSRRIVESQLGRDGIDRLYREGAIVRARALARLLKEDPSLLDDRSRFAALRDTFEVDELHVSDGKGILIASYPTNYIGYAMASHEQSAAFMPAVTNQAFEFIQEPMPKGADRRLFQYAGVARLDEPGIVQVGFFPGRLETAENIASIDKIAGTARLGRGGYVSIRETAATERIGDRRSRRSVVFDESTGRMVAQFESDCGRYRITLRKPVYGWRMADDCYYGSLVNFTIAAAVLFVVLLVSGAFAVGVRGFLGSLHEAFRVRGSRFSEAVARLSPLLFGALAVFLLGLHLTWHLADRAAFSYAENLLRHGVEEGVNDINSCVDNMLFFCGNAITRHYESPEVMAADSNVVREVMHRYHIDEINIVNSKGIVLAGDLANVGFDFASTESTRKFLPLLVNDAVYAQPFRAAIEDPSVVRKYAGVAFPRHNGFVQIGFDRKRMENDIDYGLEDIAEGWRLGERGYMIIAKRATGEILSCGHPEWERILDERGRETLAGIGFDVSLVPQDANEAFEQTLFDERCLCLAALVGDYHRVVLALPMDEVTSGRDGVMQLVGLILFVVLSLSVGLIAWLHTSNALLQKLIAEEKERQEADRRKRAEELATAKAIQTESLPVVFPDETGFRIVARMDTAKEVGGDFYDFYRVPSGKVLFLVADTSGKGIPAAMFMMKAKAILKACAFEYSTLSEAVGEANSRLAENNDANMFVTAWIGLYDPVDGHVDFVNAGHNPPLVKHADGSVTWVRTRPGLVLAAMGGARYRVEHLDLAPGETLFVYTDGVTEAMNPAGGQYGEARLEDCLAAARVRGFLDGIRENVRLFANGAEQSDDITMLTLERKIEG